MISAPRRRDCAYPERSAYVAAPIMPEGRVIGFLHADVRYHGRDAAMVRARELFDLVGINPMSELTGYFRSAVPPAYHDLMVTGINIPIRIGGVTVMPDAFGLNR